MLPRICQDCEPLSGQVRKEPQDTKIEEVLRQQPCGGGPHLWVLVKHGQITTRQVASALARSVAIDPNLVAFAAVRDRFAEVWQWFSLPAADIDHPAALKNAGYKRLLKVQRVEAHKHAITTEDVLRLKYNIRLRKSALESGLLRSKKILDRLRRDGCPNYLGYVRMGPKGQHAKWGKVLWQGKHLPKRVEANKAEQRRYLSSYQAMLCNRYIAKRIEAESFTTCMPGDVMQCQLSKPWYQREFQIAADQEQMQKRMDSWESVPCAPLFGEALQESADEALQFERAFIDELNIGDNIPKRVSGSRRAIRFQPNKVHCDDQREDLLLSCELDPDVYLSSMLEELFQPDRHII